jgi:hypothetical protein
MVCLPIVISDLFEEFFISLERLEDGPRNQI